MVFGGFIWDGLAGAGVEYRDEEVGWMDGLGVMKRQQEGCFGGISGPRKMGGLSGFVFFVSLWAFFVGAKCHEKPHQEWFCSAGQQGIIST